MIGKYNLCRSSNAWLSSLHLLRPWWWWGGRLSVALTKVPRSTTALITCYTRYSLWLFSYSVCCHPLALHFRILQFEAIFHKGVVMRILLIMGGRRMVMTMNQRWCYPTTMKRIAPKGLSANGHHRHPLLVCIFTSRIVDNDVDIVILPLFRLDSNHPTSSRTIGKIKLRRRCGPNI